MLAASRPCGVTASGPSRAGRRAVNLNADVSGRVARLMGAGGGPSSSVRGHRAPGGRGARVDGKKPTRPSATRTRAPRLLRPSYSTDADRRVIHPHGAFAACPANLRLRSSARATTVNRSPAYPLRFCRRPAGQRAGGLALDLAGQGNRESTESAIPATGSAAVISHREPPDFNQRPLLPRPRSSGAENRP